MENIDEITTIQNCTDIEELRRIAIQLQQENQKLKESYLTLSSKICKILPLIKDKVVTSDKDLFDGTLSPCMNNSRDNKIGYRTSSTQGNLRLLDTMRIFRTNIFCFKFSNRDKYLACGCYSGSILLYRYSTSMKKLKHIRTMTGHEGLVTSINWTKDDDYIVTTSIDKTIRVWKPLIGYCDRVIPTEVIVTSSCLYECDNKEMCAVVGVSNYFVFADLMNASIVKKMSLNVQLNSLLSYKQYIIAGSNEGDLIVVNYSTYDIIHRIVRPYYQVKNLFIQQLSHDKDYLLVEYRNNCLELLEIEGMDFHHLSNYLLPEEKATSSNCCYIEDMNISISQLIDDVNTMDTIEDKIIPNVFIVAGGSSGNCYLWPALKSDIPIKPKCMNVHDAPCLYFDYSTCCHLIASSSQDHTLKVWKGVS